MLKKLSALVMSVAMLTLGTVGVNAQGETQQALENLEWVQQLEESEEFELQFGVKTNMMGGEDLMELGNLNLRVKSPTALGALKTIEDVNEIKDELQVLAKINVFGMTQYTGLKDNWVYTSGAEDSAQLYRDELVDWDELTEDYLQDSEQETVKELEDELNQLGDKFFDYMDTDVSDGVVTLDIKKNEENLVNYLHEEVKPALQKIEEMDLELADDDGLSELDEEDFDEAVAELVLALKDVESFVITLSNTGFEVEITVLEGEESQTIGVYVSLVATEGITFDDVTYNETEEPDSDDYNDAPLEYVDTDSQD